MPVIRHHPYCAGPGTDLNLLLVGAVAASLGVVVVLCPGSPCPGTGAGPEPQAEAALARCPQAAPWLAARCRNWA